MARLPRLYSADTPHLLQTRLLAMAEAPTVQVLDQWALWLKEEASRLRLAVHGWSLTPREILLLLTPGDADGLRALMQALGRRIAVQRGGGKVFEGRYRSALIEAGNWVLPTLIWLEHLPVRQGLVMEAEHWRWSSARAHTGAGVQGWLAMHADYWACGNTPFDRQARYRMMLQEGLGSMARERIEASIRGQWALGSEAFLVQMTESASRRAESRPRGRPRKQDGEASASARPRS